MTLSLTEAAKVLGVHVATLRRWIRMGAPTLALGSVGRTHGTQVDPEAVKRWRAQRAVPSLSHTAQADTLGTVAVALFDTLKRDDLAACAGLTDGQAAMAVLMVFERAYKNVKREPLAVDGVPELLKPFRFIVLESLEQGTFHQRR